MTTDGWHAANQSALLAALAPIHAAIAGEAAEAAVNCIEAPTVAALCAAFGLSAFERAVLLLCAGVELDSGFAAACARAQDGAGRGHPTFGLALALLPEPHWSALSRLGPLRRWRLIELLPGDTLAASPLRISERILHFLAGAETTEEGLEGLLRPLGPALADGGTAPADAVATLSRPGGHVLLVGRHAEARREAAAQALRAVGRAPFLLQAADIPPGATERELLLCLWNRETRLTGCGLCVEIGEGDRPEMLRHATPFLDGVEGALVVAGAEDAAPPGFAAVRIELPPLSTGERRAAWQRRLGPAARRLNGALDAAIAHFSPGPQSLALLAGAMEMAPDAPEPALGRIAWRICREQSRRPMEQLARRIEPRAGWDDLVLPPAQVEMLRQIAAHLRQRLTVHETWGFAAKYSRGLGLTALFSGASGTGKTMAAEVLANSLELDLFQIDLASTVSKYIGETEKNLARLFDAAEAGGAILLFDEADALFGKRTEVKDSHDRYANLEVSYLLQRMEAYRGLAILTTNMRQAIDAAFLRRIRFILDFPFPDGEQRARIWQQVFPARAPTEGLDFAALARLSVPGGIIRNIATQAAFRAADEQKPIGMAHVLWAARLEYAKLEKPLTAAEMGGWR